MGSEAIGQLNFKVALRLGRISNLPTVWTNCLAGAVLAGGTIWDIRIIVIIFATSLFYIAGMFLNDALDWRHDILNKSNRPIPQKQVTAKLVLYSGFKLLGAGLLVLLLLAPFISIMELFTTLMISLLLCFFIIIYDLFHKSNPLSPILMGICRMLIYYIAGYALTGRITIELVLGSWVLFFWVIGITYFAKQKNWSKVVCIKAFIFLILPITLQLVLVGFNLISTIIFITILGLLFYISYLTCFKSNNTMNISVSILIASLSLIDAIFIVSRDLTGGLLVSIGFILTIGFQRKITGT